MNIIKNKNWFFAISLLLLIPSIVALALWGLKPNIDFTGGSLLEVKVVGQKQLTPQNIKKEAAITYDVDQIQATADNQFLLRGEEINNEKKEQVLERLAQLGEVTEIKFETVGPILGRELILKTVNAIILVAAIIIIYVWSQFKDIKFGVCAILGMFHDSLILLGAFSILGHFWQVEVDVLFVTALLTTLSFSIHDTIVIYDRIRALRRKEKRLSFSQVANLAILETLARSINNSLTIIFMLLALVVLGGVTIKWFSVALLIGAVAGTYSSTFTAVPLLVLWDEIKARTSKK